MLKDSIARNRSLMHKRCMSPKALLALAALAIAGCASVSIADRAEVVMLDQTVRPPSATVDLLRRRPIEPLTVIGVITYRDLPEQEARVTAAFLEIAKERGAHALVFSAGGELSLYGKGNRIVPAANIYDEAAKKGAEYGLKAARDEERRKIVFKAEMLVRQRQAL